MRNKKSKQNVWMFIKIGNLTSYPKLSLHRRRCQTTGVISQFDIYISSCLPLFNWVITQRLLQVNCQIYMPRFQFSYDRKAKLLIYSVSFYHNWRFYIVGFNKRKLCNVVWILSLNKTKQIPSKWCKSFKKAKGFQHLRTISCKINADSFFQSSSQK